MIKDQTRAQSDDSIKKKFLGFNWENWSNLAHGTENCVTLEEGKKPLIGRDAIIEVLSMQSLLIP